MENSIIFIHRQYGPREGKALMKGFSQRLPDLPQLTLRNALKRGRNS